MITYCTRKASKGLNTFKDPNAFLEGKWFSSHLLGLASTSQPFYPRVLSGFWPIAKYQKWSGVVPLSQCGFGSVRFRFLVFAIGPVRFMFGFGSCGSWSISVRFGVWNILQWYLLFFPASEKQIQIASHKRFISSRNRFHEQRLSKSGESWTWKTKASWNCQCMQFIMKKPIFAFFIELKKQLQLFQSVYWGRVRRFRFLRFGFAHGSSGSRFLRFIGYLIFYGSVPRFRFRSRTLLLSLFCDPYLQHDDQRLSDLLPEDPRGV